jgi:hypothetical protein
MRTPRLLAAPLALAPALLAAPACLPEEPEETLGLAALGKGSHDLDDVIIDVIATSADGLNGPRDLDFNPDVPGELWVVNREDDSTTTIFDAGSETQETLHLVDPFAEHFMEEVSSISFSPGMQFGTCQESRNTYNDQAAGNDFMGPALWSADFDIYAISNPEAVDENGFDLGSHLDMLHESPLCMGIAWERRNVYWTFDGRDGRISRYDFQEDHGPGFDDHSDGLIQQYTDVSVKRVADVPSHMSYDRDAGLLFIADTGNARILEVDSRTAVPLDPDPSFNLEPGVEILEEVGATVREVVASGEHYLEKPSGLALHDGYIFVTDNETSTIQVFDRDGGEFDYLELDRPEGSLMGLRVDENGHIWVVDNLANELLRIRPKGE